jgi:dihydrofolate synthase/folylpolyglutamate synthase
MRFNRLNDWLAWQESLNPAEIDLGLERISRVSEQAALFSSFNCPLITVAGTNGKGSVVAMLEAIAIAAGLKVCSYTSPHIFQYNERIKINAQAVDDDILCEAFERIDQAREDTLLTYFEFGALAAIDLFFRQQADLVIMEVGLGGRLDAVNIMDADVSVLTSVAIDHVDWLGDNRESIGYEKAGIFRAGKPVICGERLAPESVITQAEKLQCEFFQAGRDYEVIKNEKTDACWTLQSAYGDIIDLPKPSLVGEFQKLNAATAIMAMQALQSKGLISLQSNLQSEPLDNNQLIQAISTGLSRISLPGRFQQINKKPQVYVDVAHNPHAAMALATQLESGRFERKNNTWAIVAMLSDKDIQGVLENVSAEIDFWCFSGLENVTRGSSVEAFVENLPASIFSQTDTAINTESIEELRVNQCTMLTDTVLLAKTVERACKLVLSKVNENDRIIIFGSFYTVAEATQFFSD